MNQYREFTPDLIVEITRICDRNCPGCYAPNVISQGLPFDLYEQSPELFLRPETFRAALQSDALKGVRSIAFRGGEPSKHPFLYELIEIAHTAAGSSIEEIYVETHGRWILNPLGYYGLMMKASKYGSWMKISYDRMHGLSSVDVQEITNALNKKDMKWIIAITESSEERFLETRSKIAWIPNEQIIYQKKAENSSELVKPNFGVMSVNGRLSSELTVKKEFLPIMSPIEASL